MPFVKRAEAEESLEQTAQHVQYFTGHIGYKLEQWKQYFQQMHIQGRRAVIWGSGSKCVGFMTTLGIKNEIEYIDSRVRYKDYLQRGGMSWKPEDVDTSDFGKSALGCVCPGCQSFGPFKKNGFTYLKYGRKQKFKCLTCGREFS